jgi:hypothetical protein
MKCFLLLTKYGFSIALMIAFVGCLTAQADSVDGSFNIVLTTPTSGPFGNGGADIDTPFGDVFAPAGGDASFNFDPITGRYNFSFGVSFGFDCLSRFCLSGDGFGSASGILPTPIIDGIPDGGSTVGTVGVEYLYADCVDPAPCHFLSETAIYDFSLLTELPNADLPGFYGTVSVTFEPAPEPGTLALFALGIVPLLWLSKRGQLLTRSAL